MYAAPKIKQQQGVTLVELLVTIAIIALLLGVALPGYQGFVVEAKREDARHLLEINVSRLERCFTLEGAYNGNCFIRDTSEDGLYEIDADLDRSTYTLTATPVAGESQQDDADCTSFVIDQLGRKTATGADPSTCW